MAKGDRYRCEVCGVECVIDELCGCSECDLICCERPMKRVSKPKAAPKKTVKKKK